jgi:hypothetical protein
VAWRESPIEEEGKRRHYWLKSLQKAAACAMEVEYVLSLAEPKTFEALEDFFGSDVEEAGATKVILEAVAGSIGVRDRIDVKSEDMWAEFDAASSALDAFIRSNFKLEEIRAATPPRWSTKWDLPGHQPS